MSRDRYLMKYNVPRTGTARLCYCKNTYTKDCKCDKYPHWEQGIGSIDVGGLTDVTNFTAEETARAEVTVNFDYSVLNSHTYTIQISTDENFSFFLEHTGTITTTSMMLVLSSYNQPNVYVRIRSEFQGEVTDWKTTRV